MYVIKKLCRTHMYARSCKGNGTEAPATLQIFAYLRVRVATPSIIGLLHFKGS